MGRGRGGGWQGAQDQRTHTDCLSATLISCPLKQTPFGFLAGNCCLNRIRRPNQSGPNIPLHRPIPCRAAAAMRLESEKATGESSRSRDYDVITLNYRPERRVICYATGIQAGRGRAGTRVKRRSPGQILVVPVQTRSCWPPEGNAWAMGLQYSLCRLLQALQAVRSHQNTKRNYHYLHFVFSSVVNLRRFGCL